MGLWTTLFSSSDTVEKVTDAVISTGDKLFYTDEEKADDRRKQREFFPTLLKAYTPFKVAQRVLAIWFSFLFGISFLTALGMEIFNIVIKYQALRDNLVEAVLLDTQPIINLIGAFSLAWIVMAIVSFYFAGGTIESFRNARAK